MILSYRIKGLIYVFIFSWCLLLGIGWMSYRRTSCLSWSLSGSRCAPLSGIVCLVRLFFKLMRKKMFLLVISFIWMLFYCWENLHFFSISIFLSSSKGFCLTSFSQFGQKPLAPQNLFFQLITKSKNSNPNSIFLLASLAF